MKMQQEILELRVLLKTLTSSISPAQPQTLSPQQTSFIESSPTPPSEQRQENDQMLESPQTSPSTPKDLLMSFNSSNELNSYNETSPTAIFTQPILQQITDTLNSNLDTEPHPSKRQDTKTTPIKNLTQTSVMHYFQTNSSHPTCTYPEPMASNPQNEETQNSNHE